MSTARITATAEYLTGEKTIAAELGVTVKTMIGYARLAEDPLPIRVRRGQPRIHSGHLAEWKRRREGGSTLPKLRGGRAIRDALGEVDRATMERWARLPHDRLPVYGLGDKKHHGSPWAYESAVRDWLLRGDLPFQAHDRLEPEPGKVTRPRRPLAVDRVA